MTDNEILDEIGLYWNDINIYKHCLNWHDKRCLARQFYSRTILSQIRAYIPELFLNKYSVLDFSCGSGIFLEIMKILGHNICGVDVPDNEYKILIKSQNTPVVYHDCSSMPYPFENQSFDVIYNNSAITFYKTNWNKVLDEFFRISKNIVFICVNKGIVFDNNKYILDSYNKDGWELVFQYNTIYKWVKK